MPRLTRPQLAARECISVAAKAPVTPETFAGEVLDALRAAIGYDDCRFFGMDPASRLLSRLFAATDSDTHFRRRWLSEIYLTEQSQTPYFAPQVLMDFGVDSATFHQEQDQSFGLSPAIRESVGAQNHWQAFHATNTPLGGVIRLLIGQPGQWIGMIDLVRRSGDLPFRAVDYLFAHSLRGIIAAGLARALQRERAGSQEPSDPLATGVVIVSRTGEVTYASPAGEAWARRLRDDLHQPIGTLPTAFWSTIASHRNRGHEPAVITVPHSDGTVRIEAADGGADGSVVVVITMAKRSPREVIPATWNLTLAERRVAELLITGARNREIAAQLGIAIPTVETHLSHLYEKLGVKGRAGLMTQLFTERFLPGFSEPK